MESVFQVSKLSLIYFELFFSLCLFVSCGHARYSHICLASKYPNVVNARIGGFDALRLYPILPFSLALLHNKSEPLT